MCVSVRERKRAGERRGSSVMGGVSVRVRERHRCASGEPS